MMKKMMRMMRATGKMLKSSFSSAWSRGKPTILIVVAALTLATATPALAATGGNFLLGMANTATGITQLTANIANPAMKLINTSTSTGATALNLQTASTKPPMTVNSATKVTNLNADTVDGKDSSAIGRELWAVVDSDRTIVRSNGVISRWADAPYRGWYHVTFDRDVSKCAYVATTTNGQAGQTGVDEGYDPNEVQVFTASSDGSAANLPFHLIVTC